MPVDDLTNRAKNPKEITVAESPEKLPIPALTSVVVALVALLAHQLNPLDSSRPPIPSSQSSHYVNIQDINARLWQDPFSAISDAETDNEKTDKAPHSWKQLTDPADKRSKHTIDALVGSILEMSTSKNQPITVLGVMVSGGAYAENVEERRRARYAVLSGLAVKEYAPKDHEHIGYIETPKGVHIDNMPEKIPFEWFNTTNNSRNDQPVLVLWLDDAVFSSIPEPLQEISHFVDFIKNSTTTKRLLTKETTDERSKQTPELIFKFIGPASSNTLQTIVDELANQQSRPIGYPFEFYNAAATGDWPGIKIPATAKEGHDKEHKTIDTYLKSIGLASIFTRTSLTDYQLASALVKELELREFQIEIGKKTYIDKSPIIEGTHYGMLGSQTQLPFNFSRESYSAVANECKNNENQRFSFVRCINTIANVGHLSDHIELEIKLHPKKVSFYPRKNKDHIVIISEWDTVFGRLGLPKALKEQLIPMESYCLNSEIRENKCDWPSDVKWIHTFSYMRGLDGILPGAEKKSDETKANKDQDPHNNSETNLERPEGQSQQDYLRRLAAHIDEINQQLKNDDEGEIKAIGVLGSDAYDKLMILKALRPSFPKAVFFTTDLDTRLMHPKEFDVTRNLIVAASFDLKLAENLQKSIPPFRDSYQTAHFFATQIALNDANGEKLSQETINEMLGKAELFEVGHNKAIPLNSNNNNKSCETLQECKNVHPLSPQKDKKLNFILALSLPTVIWIIPLIYILSRNWDLDRTARIPTLSAWLFLFWIFVFILTYLGSFFVFYRELGLGDKGEPFYWNEGISVWPSEIIRLFAGILTCLFLTNAITSVMQSGREITSKFNLTSLGNVANLWKNYCSGISSPQCIGRVVFYSVGFILVAIILMEMFGYPSVPYRGEVSYYANILALGFSVIFFVILVMTVCVITWHSIKLITQLGECDSAWPKEALIYFNLVPKESSDTNKLSDLRKQLGNKYHLDEWLDIEFIAAHTRVVGNLVYYPFIILALMIFARSKIFDNWDMPINLVIIFLSAAALILGSAFYLRRVAEHARKNSIKKITGMKMALVCQLGSDDDTCKAMEKQIDLVLAQIQEIKEGAFQPLTHEPAFQALLIPFGSFGGVELLENLVLNGLL